MKKGNGNAWHIWILNSLTTYRKWGFDDTGKLIMFFYLSQYVHFALVSVSLLSFIFLAKSAIIRGLSSSRWNVYSRCACRIELNAGLAIVIYRHIYSYINWEFLRLYNAYFLQSSHSTFQENAFKLRENIAWYLRKISCSVSLMNTLSDFKNENKTPYLVIKLRAK